MSLVRIRVVVLIIVCFLASATFLINILGGICPAELVCGSVEEPIVIIRDHDLLCTGISQIVSDENNIYVLYGNYSVVQVYTRDGRYRYSISVCNHVNGRTQIAAYESSLYVCDKIDNVFIFRDGAFVELVEKSASAEIIDQVPFGVSDSNYVVHSGSVWYAPKGAQPHCVIKRPAWLSVYQNNLLTTVLFILIILGGVLIKMPHLSKTR